MYVNTDEYLEGMTHNHIMRGHIFSPRNAKRSNISRISPGWCSSQQCSAGSKPPEDWSVSFGIEDQRESQRVGAVPPQHLVLLTWSVNTLRAGVVQEVVITNITLQSRVNDVYYQVSFTLRFCLLRFSLRIGL